MLKTEVNLEMLIKSYAKTTSDNGIFVSILEFDENLSRILDIPEKEFHEYVYGYFYLTDFDNEEEMRALFNRITDESHPDAQYAVLVVNGEIVEEYPDW